MEFLRSLPAGGTLFNVAAVLFGGSLGLFAGRLIPERLRKTVFDCLGLFTLYVGLEMALKMERPLAVLLSLVFGGVLGGLLRLDDRMSGLGDWLKSRMGSSSPRFTEGFVTATLLFCVGAMAIVGSLEDGLRHDPGLLVTKGVMDGISSAFFAGSFGIGVLFSVVPLIVYQGGLTLLAVWAAPFLTPEKIADISGLGGLMVTGIGLNLLGLTKLKLGDLLPGLALILLFLGVL